MFSSIFSFSSFLINLYSLSFVTPADPCILLIFGFVVLLCNLLYTFILKIPFWEYFHKVKLLPSSFFAPNSRLPGRRQAFSLSANKRASLFLGCISSMTARFIISLAGF
jgi:hypothetical protein